MDEPPGPHDPDGLVMAALVSTCPSFAAKWTAHRSEWDEDGTERSPYVDAGVFARHLVDLRDADTTSEFETVFGEVERLLLKGDAGVRYLTTFGLMESLGNQASNRHGWPWAEQFTKWFGPRTKEAWDEVHELWGTGPGM